ncbi:MAG TPA: nucleotidyltransferase family protein [Bryobacteraceae bacterium]|nr:nucleotidyltransferase family protein [Bryobacteraceae bacterium]
MWLTFLVGDIAAIVLAAGRSRRMGAFKALLPFGEDTVIECSISNLRAAEIEDIVVVVGHRAAEIRQRLRDLNLTYAVNPNPDSEMGESIARGVEQVNANVRALLIALVDHPAVPAATIRMITDEWRGGARLVQPEHGGRGGHPVLIDLVYRSELLALDPEAGLRALFAAHHDQVKRVPVESPYVARDMDTWEDYRRLHEAVFGVAPATK